MNAVSLVAQPASAARLADGQLPTAVGGLYGAADALLLTRLAAALDAPLLHVAEDQQTADRLEAEARFLAPDDLPILHFPDWETLAYDNFSPHQDIVSQRLRVLSALPGLKRGLLIVAAPCVLHRLPPTDYVASQSLRLAAGQQLDLESFVAGLVDAGYLQGATGLGAWRVRCARLTGGSVSDGQWRAAPY